LSRSGKLRLPNDPSTRALVIFCMQKFDFNPTKLNEDFNEECRQRGREMQTQQERAAEERRKQIDESAKHCLDFADVDWEFELRHTGQRFSVKDTSIHWPLSSETGCPKAGKKVALRESLLLPILRQYAEGHKKSLNPVDLALYLSQHTGPNDDWLVGCGELRCAGLSGGGLCNQIRIRLVRKGQ